MRRMLDAATRQASLAVAGVALAGLLAGAERGCADSAIPPAPADFASANGQFVFKVIPRMLEDPAPGLAPEEQLPRGILTVRRGSETNELWSVQLVNETAPVESVVADDGRHVVTLDNWYRAGYGPDVIVFYGPKGLIRKYSLEEALDGLVPVKGRWYLALPKPARRLVDFAGLAPASVGIGNLFPHSVSSRGWRGDGFHLIEPWDGRPLFCLWLDRLEKWLVFRMTDGERLAVSGDLRERLDLAGRTWALRQCREGEHPLEAARYLMRFNRPEDRSIIGEGFARYGSVDLASFLHPIDAARLKRFTAIPGIRAVRAVVPPGQGLTLEELLAGLSAFSVLERLDLETMPIPDWAAATLGGFRTLRMISLRSTQITDVGLAAVCQNDQLEDLCLAENPITDAGVAALEPLQRLRVLNLEGTRITDAGLGHLKGLTTLTNLYLDGQGITDRGIENLMALQSLGELSLPGTRVTDAGVARLAALPRLRWLMLNNAPITDACLATFQAMPALRSVYVWNTAISAGAVAELQRARPDLNIIGP